jgi:hypothetical protein
MFAMALLTFLVGPLVLHSRVRSVRNGFVQIEYYEIFQGGTPPGDVIQTSRHWSNLYEAPVLFYVVCLISLALGLEATWLGALAWVYVILRILHTFVHLTYNRVYHRLSLFLASQVILIVMWVTVFIMVV